MDERWSWDQFEDLGMDVEVQVNRNMRRFSGWVSWVGKDGGDKRAALDFDEAENDADFDAFMVELLAQAKHAA